MASFEACFGDPDKIPLQSAKREIFDEGEGKFHQRLARSGTFKDEVPLNPTPGGLQGPDPFVLMKPRLRLAKARED
jgi:hypothetical protein